MFVGAVVRDRRALGAACICAAMTTAVSCGAQDRAATQATSNARSVFSVDENGRRSGTFAIPKSRQFIAGRLTAISKMPFGLTGEAPQAPGSIRDALRSREFLAQQEVGLRALAAYRFLCDVPYEDLEIDRDYAAHALAGAKLLTKVGMLTHTPENPGLPDDEYQFALKGTSSSNICTSDDLRLAMEIYIDDSDAGNIEQLGHRRWCLNPAMLKTGFGAEKSGHSCMRVMDFGRKNAPDFDFVAYPPRGLMPTGYFKRGDAWSVSLNPAKFQKPDPSVKASAIPARFDPANSTVRRAGPPLEIDSVKVSYENFGTGACIIFRPEKCQGR